MLKQVLFLIVFGSLGILAIRHPDLIARLLVIYIRIDVIDDNFSETQEMAHIIRNEGLKWRTRYPQLYQYIVGSGYISFIICVFLILGLLAQLFNFSDR